VRFNIATTIVYILGIILLVRLFDLQIVNGQRYREQSNTRLTRETTLKAARGNILDSSGNKLVSTGITNNVEIYKTKADNTSLNNGLLLFANTLEQNGDTYVDTFPVTVNPYAFKDGVNSETFKSQNSLDSSMTPEDVFNYYKNRYKVETDNLNDARKIITLRFAIEQSGYSNIKAVKLASNISNASFAKINEMSSSFPGISTYNEPTVSYPYKELASHVLGYVAPVTQDDLAKDDSYDQNDVIGRTGVEKAFEKYLKGKDGVKQVDMSVDGQVTDEYISEEAQAGSDVVLTIDAELQKKTEEALANTISSIKNSLVSSRLDKPDEGAAVVVNVKTGEVLAMASYPNYDPSLFIGGISQANWSNYLNDSRHVLVNKAIADKSAPGSTFKMVTAIAGLESGAITTSTKINDTGRYTYYKDYQPYCWSRSGHGWQNVTQAIEHSCNYFFYETGRRAGIDQLVRVAKSFGLGSKTGIELPEEISGTLASPETEGEWTGGKTIQAAIGQLNNDFTPLQMAKYTAMIANGGKNIDITIIKSIKNSNGTEVSRNELDNYIKETLGVDTNSGSDLTISDADLNAVKEGMKGVTSDDGGTAHTAFANFNIEVGGKTGSASTRNGNANAWFVGFAPYDNPEIAIAVYVKNGQHGNSTAPVAREIFAQYLGMNSSSITEDMTATSESQGIY
jgi:penicillin-binding protein 2